MAGCKSCALHVVLVARVEYCKHCVLQALCVASIVCCKCCVLQALCVVSDVRVVSAMCVLCVSTLRVYYFIAQYTVPGDDCVPRVY